MNVKIKKYDAARCPVCCGKTYVTNVRSKTGYRYRYRKCYSCGYSYQTGEFIVHTDMSDMGNIVICGKEDVQE